jgi:hypothetical protein
MLEQFLSSFYESLFNFNGLGKDGKDEKDKCEMERIHFLIACTNLSFFICSSTKHYNISWLPTEWALFWDNFYKQHYWRSQPTANQISK